MKAAKKKRILVVDDELEICTLISDYLSPKGLDVQYVTDGKKALNNIKSRKPDLIILDIMMPVMDGFTLLSYLKSKPQHSKIPVIVLTVKSSPKYLKKGISLETEFYLPKPFQLENLMNFIDLILTN
jgi:DNA-binding response OmpR family regulator